MPLFILNSNKNLQKVYNESKKPIEKEWFYEENNLYKSWSGWSY